MIKKKNTSIVWLDNARIIAIFAVVFLHTAAYVVAGEELGASYWWIGNIYEASVRWSVPVFVMMSGALLLGLNKNEDIVEFYKKRAGRLLIPTIFWSLFFIFWFPLESGITLISVIKSVLTGRPHYHLWFLYMILGLYVFTPYLRKIYSNSSKNERIIFTGVVFLIAMLDYAYLKLNPETSLGVGTTTMSALFIDWFLMYIPYFFLGEIIKDSTRIYSTKILLGLFLFTVSLSSAFLFIFTTHVTPSSADYSYGYLSIFVVPMSIAIFYLLKKLNKPIFGLKFTEKISRLSLGIYLVHPIFLDKIKDILLEYNPIVAIPAATIVVFLISLFLSLIISRVPYINKII